MRVSLLITALFMTACGQKADNKSRDNQDDTSDSATKASTAQPTTNPETTSDATEAGAMTLTVTRTSYTDTKDCGSTEPKMQIHAEFKDSTHVANVNISCETFPEPGQDHLLKEETINPPNTIVRKACPNQSGVWYVSTLNRADTSQGDQTSSATIRFDAADDLLTTSTMRVSLAVVLKDGTKLGGHADVTIADEQVVSTCEHGDAEGD